MNLRSWWHFSFLFWGEGVRPPRCSRALRQVTALLSPAPLRMRMLCRLYRRRGGWRGGVCWGVRRGSCQTGVADPMQWGEHENSISPCVVFKARSRREQRTAPTPQDVLDWSHADGSLVARRSTKIPTAAIGNQIIILKLKSQPTWSVSSLLCEGFMFHSRFSKVPATSVNSIEAESRFFFFYRYPQ